MIGGPRWELRHASPHASGYCFDGGGSSSSSSNASTTVTTDKRLAIESGIGISSDSSTVNVTTLDAGIVAKALDTVASADATAGQGFDKLLGLADKLFTGGFKALESSQSLTTAAFSAGVNDKAGALDNRTIAIGVVAIAAAWAWKK